MNENPASQLPLPGKHEIPAEDRDAFREELRTDAYHTFLDILSYPVNEIVRRTTRGSKTVPFWFSILILESLILGLGFGISALVREFQGSKIQILEFFNVLISFCFIVLVKSYFDKLRVEFCSDLIEYVNSQNSLKEIKDWFVLTTKRKEPLIYGMLFSIAFSMTLAFYGPFLFYHTKGGFLGWGPLVLSLLANLLIGTGGYYLWISRNFRVQAKLWDFKIYELNPSKSIVILKLSKLLSIPVAIGAFLSALTTLAFSVVRSFPLLILVIVVISGWYPMLSLFVRNHIALASIITRAKQKKLSELQDKIAELEPESLKSSSGVEHLQKLIDYHDRIASTPNTALNFRITLGFLNTLLLPLLTLILANLDTIIKLFP